MRELNLLDLDKFPNQLGLVGFTSAEAEERVSKFELKEQKANVTRVEKEIKWPKFVKYMWAYIFKNHGIPEQQVFYKGYLKCHEEFIKKQKLTKKEEDGLEGRIYRAFTSLIRDVIFSLQLKEILTKHGVEVIYNVQLDLRGVDILLIHDNKKYALELFVDTKNSRYWRKIKEGRNSKFDHVKHIEMPLPVGGRRKLNNIWMYGEIDFDRVNIQLSLCEGAQSTNPEPGDENFWEDF